MAVVRKTITVTVMQDEWIKSQVEAGRFANDSEYIRKLVLFDLEQQKKLEALRAAIIEGENSGEPQPFDFAEFKEEMRQKYIDV